MSDETPRVVPSWMSEPPEPVWPGDWRLDDPREERLTELNEQQRRRTEDDQ